MNTPKLNRLLLLSGLVFLSSRLAVSQPTFTIAFGSCSHQYDKDQMWTDVVRQKPNLWMWIGDNIYGDTHNMDSMRLQYQIQKNNPDYQALLKQMPVIGTWDDHDYGANDGGKFFSQKAASKNVMLEFLDVPAAAEVRKHEGVYQSFVYGKGKHKVKVLLLDTRWFRDTLALSHEKGQKYQINTEGDILGEAQWAWLEKELVASDAKLHIIASSIQFLAQEHRFEKWANFPKARKRMLDLIEKVKPANTLFVSGDRHMAEISKLDMPGLSYPLYDFTSSGLTHTWDKPWEEMNTLRVGKLIIEKNYGLITIDWQKKKPSVTLQIRGANNKLFGQETIKF